MLKTRQQRARAVPRVIAPFHLFGGSEFGSNLAFLAFDAHPQEWGSNLKQTQRYAGLGWPSLVHGEWVLQ